MDINTDFFISEIEKTSVIWDMSSSAYANKTSKRKAWKEMVLVHCNSEDSEERKKALGLELQKKWKSLRDGYVRETRRLKNIKSGSAAPAKSSYLYHSRLQFLQRTIAKNSTESSFELDVADQENQVPLSENLNQDHNVQNANQDDLLYTHPDDTTKTINQGDSFKTPSQQHGRKKMKLRPADEHFTKMIEKSLNQKKENDEDKLFCLSLFRELKKLPENMHLKTKIGTHNSILQNQITTQSSKQSEMLLSNSPSTSFGQRSAAYQQYGNYQSYTAIPHGTLQYPLNIQINQNVAPLQTSSPLSGVSEASHKSSDYTIL